MNTEPPQLAKGHSLLGIVGAILLVATGCTSTAKKTNFLDANVKLRPGTHLENIWCAEGLNEEILSKIYFQPVDVTRIRDHGPITTEVAAQRLETEIVFNIESQTKWRNVETPDTATIQFDLAVTHLTPGSSFGRIMAGEFGAGSAVVQVEGKLTDARNGSVKFCFSDRRSSSGYMGFEDTVGDAGPKLVNRLLAMIAEDLAKELIVAVKSDGNGLPPQTK